MWGSLRLAPIITRRMQGIGGGEPERTCLCLRACVREMDGAQKSARMGSVVVAV